MPKPKADTIRVGTVVAIPNPDDPDGPEIEVTVEFPGPDRFRARDRDDRAHWGDPRTARIVDNGNTI